MVGGGCGGGGGGVAGRTVVVVGVLSGIFGCRLPFYLHGKQSIMFVLLLGWLRLVEKRKFATTV